MATGLYHASTSVDRAPIPYANFFGLRENPFSLSPDPRYLHRTRQAHETLSQLTRGILARKGLIVLSGEVGTGKTTLLNTSIRLLKLNPAIGSKIRTALIVHPTLTPDEFLETLLDEFRIPCSSTRKPGRLEALLQMLLELHRHGGIAVLMIDEAQLLSTDLLDEIRLLLNLRTAHQQLLQVVLCGQPEIEDKLDRNESCRPLASAAIRCKTVPLTLDDTRDYIQHRLKVAGAKSASIFARDAVDAAHLYSQGIPRVVNVLCAHALATADISRIQQISAHLIEAAAATIPFANANPPAPRVYRFLSATAVATVQSAPVQPTLTLTQPQARPTPQQVLRPQSVQPYNAPQLARHESLQPYPASQAARPESLPPRSTRQSATNRSDHRSPSRGPLWISACNQWLNRWWTESFTFQSYWKALTQAGLAGMVLFALARALGSAVPWRHSGQVIFGFLGLLLIDVSLGLAAYLLLRERSIQPGATGPVKLFWASYKRLFSLFS